MDSYTPDSNCLFSLESDGEHSPVFDLSNEGRAFDEGFHCFEYVTFTRSSSTTNVEPQRVGTRQSLFRKHAVREDVEIQPLLSV